VKRFCFLALFAVVLLPLVACGQSVYVTATDYQVATVTLPETEYLPSTVFSTVTSPPLTNTATATVTSPPVTTTFVVTAPPVTTTVTLTPTVAPTTTTAPPQVGMLVGTFAGNGSKTTSIFTTSSSTWWIQYSCQLLDPGNPTMAFTFSVYPNTPGVQYIKSLTFQTPTLSSTYIYEQSGTFYIDVTSANATWTLNVYQPL
jgi:hypothetical protein